MDGELASGRAPDLCEGAELCAVISQAYREVFTASPGRHCPDLIITLSGRRVTPLPESSKVWEEVQTVSLKQVRSPNVLRHGWA
jgi:hypothetical protein